jgi:hypothetical protein
MKAFPPAAGSRDPFQRSAALCYPGAVDGRLKRRENRFAVQLHLTLKQGQRIQTLLTENVSYRGLFVRTDTPPPLRQLVKLEAVLPPLGVRFVSHAMSVFVIRPEDATGRAPGAGIQFYGMGDERRAWEAFVNHAKRQAGGTSVEMPAVTDLPGPEPVRRRFERVPLVLEVVPHTVDELMKMWTRDVSAGGMFLTSDDPAPIGTELKLEIKHPATGERFHLEAIVRRHGNKVGKGVGVELIGMSEARRRDFFTFVTSTVPSMTPEELGIIEVD